MTDSANFVNLPKFHKTMNLINQELYKSKEDFIIHFKKTYSDPYPPAWIVSEVLPFGIITNIYNNIKDKKIKKKISQSFGLQIAPFQSWLTIVTLTRNTCCHHSRVWNKQNTIRPMSPKKMTYPWITLQTDPLRVYYNICIIKYFLDIISPNNDMLQKMKTLFANYPEIDLNALGFPQEWESEPLWR
jgi:abi-like protein